MHAGKMKHYIMTILFLTEQIPIATYSTVAFVCYPVDPYSNPRPFLALVSEPDPLHREDERSGDVPTFELS